MALDAIAPQFRRAADRWPAAATLRAHYEAVEAAFDGAHFPAVELVKAFVECVCRTILIDRGVPSGIAEAQSTELLVSALRALGVENTRGVSRFDRVLSQYNKLCDTLNEFRNQDGAVAHGRDGFLEPLTHDHARLYLLIGDTLLSVLLNAEQRLQPDLRKTREPHEVFTKFNQMIDDGVALRVDPADDEQILVVNFRTAKLPDGVTLRIEPSRVLYYLDREAYVELLDSLPQVELPVAAPVDTPAPEALGAREPVRTPALTARYAGPHERLVGELTSHLAGDVLDASARDQLVASALTAFDEDAGLDWAAREPERARVLVRMKRIVAQVAVPHELRSVLPEKIVDWLADKLPSVVRSQ